MQEKYIKVNKPSGVEEYKVLNAFEKDGIKYIVLDSKLKDSNQLTITFISKINGSNLEYMEGKEWDDFVKQQLIPVVKGISDSVCFVPEEEYEAGEQFGHPLALKDAHVNALISNYQPLVETKFEEVQPVLEVIEEHVPEMVNPIESVIETPIEENNSIDIPEDIVREIPVEESVVIDQPITMNIEQPKVQIENPVISEQPAIDSSVDIDINIPTPEIPVVEENTFISEETEVDITSLSNQISEVINAEKNKIINNAKEEAVQIIARAKEEAAQIIADANNVLANAQAKEQVAEIAYNNAQIVNQDNSVIDIQNYQNEEQGPTLSLSQPA